MKKGLPNILPLPIVFKSLGKFFRQCPCFFALHFGKHKHVPHSWTGVLAQDDTRGFEFAGNAFQIDAAPTNIVPLACVSCSFMA